MKSTKLISTRKTAKYAVAIALFSFIAGMAIEAKIISSKLAALPDFEVLK